MKLLMHEVLQKVSNAKTKKEKITLLEKFNTPALRMLFIINFDESVVSLLPPGKVPYQPNDAPVGTEHTISKGLDKYITVEDASDIVFTTVKHLQSNHRMFIQIMCKGYHK